MSEKTSENQTGGPACEGESFIVEVIGEQHPEGHEFRIYDETDQQQQEWLEGQVKEENPGSSVLHIWPWKGQPTRNVWLDIAAEEGSAIRVPLFEGVASSKREMEKQQNRILPLVPLTLIHDPEPEPGHPKEHLVPVRPGFIYVFRNGGLWRELEVQYADSGVMEFRDVRLTDYRQGRGKGVTEDRRPPAGKAQPAIWVPVSEMNRSLLSEFEIAFSEVQWSAQRIAYLEASDSARKERCQSLKGPEPRPEIASQPADREKPGRLISLLKLPEMRLREPYLEQNLSRPWKSVYDLKGQYSRNLYSQAREEAEAFAENKESASSAWEHAGYRDSALKGAPAARLAALESQLSGEDSELWQALGETGDSLAESRDAGYTGVILQDHLFCIRHHVSQALSAQSLIETVAQLAQKSEHIESAHLVQTVILPEKLGGKKNPLNEFSRHLDTTYFGPLHMALRSAQRRIAREELARAQKLVSDIIKSTEYQSVLADLFTLKKADYLEGFAVCSNIFQVLCQNPNDWDAESEREVVSDDQVRDANDLLLKIIEEGSDQPLHAMIFPTSAQLAGNTDGSSPEECGDGRCRPEELSSISEELPDTEESQSLTAIALAGVAKDDSLNLATELKRWSAAVNTLLDGLDKHVRALLNKLRSRTLSVSGKFYGPLLRMAKARDPSLMGAVQLVARNAVPQGWLVLGVHDPEIGLKHGLTQADRDYRHQQNQHRRFYGEIYDNKGDILATTAKSKLPTPGDDIDPGNTRQARNVTVYAAPADSEVVNAHRKVRSISKWNQLVDEIRVPYLILAIEATNIWNEGLLFKRTVTEKGELRAFAGAASASIDLLYAGILATERLSKDLSIWGNLPKALDAKVFDTTGTLVQRVFPMLSRVLPEIVTWKIIGGLVTGGLALAVSGMDVVHEIDTGDYDAAAAYGLAFVGTGMTIYGGLLLSKAAGSGVGALALAGPWGWVAAGIVLAVAGGVAAVFLDDEPLEEWLKRGPFGSEQDDAYRHLKDNPVESFYRLVDQLSRPRIDVQSGHNFNVKAVERGYVLTPEQDREFSRVNAVVLVENNLCGLLDGTSLTVEMRSVDTSYSGSNWGLGKSKKMLADVEVIAEEPTQNGKRLYLMVSEANLGSLKSGLEVRAQWRVIWDARYQCHNLAFPAPKLDDERRFDPAVDAKPIFHLHDQPFWADQETHTVS